MSKNVKTQISNIIGESLNSYYSKVKPTIDDLKFRQEYQDRIINCMVGEVDDNYIETPETNEPIVKLEYSKEGLVKVPSIKGKTILVDADGNETDTPAEGCRLVSVGEDEDNKLIILSKNKNLFDKENVIKNSNLIIKHSINSDSLSLTFTSYNGWGGFKYKNLDITKTYTISFIPSGNLNECRIGWHVGEVFNQKRFNTINTICKVTITNIDSFSMETNMSIGGTVTFSNIQIEEGSNQTLYIEPESHKTEILLNEPLNGISNINNFYDYIMGNKIIRNTQRVVFNGTENWGMADSLIDKYDDEVVLDFNSDIYKKTENMKPSSRGIADNGFTYTTSVIHKKGKQIGINANGKVYLRIPKSELKDSSSGINVRESVKEFLKENNVTVIVYAKEPIIEELPNGITLQGFDDTTMYIENSITPTVSYGYNALIPYKEELSQQKEEVETNTLDIENNIIPYLMDMEYNLMTMEDK